MGVDVFPPPFTGATNLVNDQQEVTAETVDWDVVQAFSDTDYSSVTAVPATPATPATHAPARKVAPKQSTGPQVYLCGNGRMEVYYSSKGCSAMRRCTYQTLVTSASQARSSGLRGCSKCY